VSGWTLIVGLKSSASQPVMPAEKPFEADSVV